jgi:hypothetical protein
MACSPEIGLGIEEAVQEKHYSVAKAKRESGALVGWQQIARFLGQTISVAQKWAKSGMPVTHEGRRVYASAETLNGWLGRESAGEPVQIVTENTDLRAELKRGLSYVRKQSRGRTPKKRAA